jgi:hypothetical protein
MVLAQGEVSLWGVIAGGMDKWALKGLLDLTGSIFHQNLRFVEVYI